MNRSLYLLFVILFLNSCIEEYDKFYPYKNIELSYLNDMGSAYIEKGFINNEGLKFELKSGLVIDIAANSFVSNTNELALKFKEIDSPKDIIINRISLIDDRRQNCFASNFIFDFSIQDKNGNSVEMESDMKLTLKIPSSGIIDPHIYLLNSKGNWDEIKNNNYDIERGSWKINNGDEIKTVKGYIIKTNNIATFSLGKPLVTGDIDDIQIKLNKGFDVSNSIVQIYNKANRSNIELLWDQNKQAFVLPENIKIPGESSIVLVLSEKYGSQPFFGIKYADIKNKDIINIEVHKMTLEELNENLEKI